MGVVKHIYEGRVEGNGMSPERVARMLKEVFHGKGNIVGQGNASHIQEIRKPGNVKSKAPGILRLILKMERTW
ncbi:MAG: hypothetical protein J6J35_00430 [Alphaproteobacteria bacterium]|nr:hypothetical protein [Alphaproteobacteria bacterium]